MIYLISLSSYNTLKKTKKEKKVPIQMPAMCLTSISLKKEKKERKETQLANKPLKTCSKFLVNKETQIKITMRFCFTPTRMTLIKNKNKTNPESLLAKMKKSQNSPTLLVVIKMLESLGKNAGSPSKD